MATEHEVFVYMIGMGMPEGLDGRRQCEWLLAYHQDLAARQCRDAAEIERLQADAGRLQWLIANKIQSHSLHMDGNRSFRFRGGWPELRGMTFREAIDEAAKASREGGGEG